MITIILAGGLGKRMCSPLPKVLHIVNDKPMIYYVVQNALAIGSTKILIVVGKYKTLIKEEISKYFDSPIFEYIDQDDPMGTGHAIKCTIPYFLDNQVFKQDDVLILSGDVPLLQLSTLQKLTSYKNSLLITESENPTGCGRVCFSNNRNIKKIIEEKDCDIEEKKIKFVNCGVYFVTVDLILETVPQITNDNVAKEYYLTDFVEIALRQNYFLNTCELSKEHQHQVININTIDDLMEANLRMTLPVDSLSV
jgi:bifunctional N-acetylglucosamine-1-phosphate-uridyltransferase/glucosamine-1-phosphate-acetyltransferase GlmU-like protein